MYDTAYHNSDLGKFSFLVTGGAGFIGSHIIEYLLKYKAGHVRVIDNMSTGLQGNIDLFKNNPNFEFQLGDISNLDDCNKACKGVDFIFHQAALGSVPRSIKDPLATNQSNVTGSLNLLMAAKENKIKRVVYASSSSVFGDSPHLPKKEDNIGNPLSPYAVTKRVNELYAHVFTRVYGMEIIGLRYFNIFGPRQNPEGQYAAAIPLFIQALLENISPYINGDGEQSRDFTFVENAVQANIRAMFIENDTAKGEVFNIAVGEQITINELFRTLKQFSGNTTEAIYRDDRPGDVRHSLADISKASEILGYKPGIFAKEGLKTTFDWFKNHYNKTI